MGSNRWRCWSGADFDDVMRDFWALANELQHESRPGSGYYDLFTVRS